MNYRSGTVPIVHTIPELGELCSKAEMKLVACQMTVDLFGWKQEDHIPEVSQWKHIDQQLHYTTCHNVHVFIFREEG